MVRGLVPKAETISASAYASPHLASAKSKMRAWVSFRAAAFPMETICSNSSRSFTVRATRYLSIAALLALRHSLSLKPQETTFRVTRQSKINGTLGPSLTNTTCAIGLAAVPGFVRLTRGQALAIREEDYVQGAHAVGASDLCIFWRYILPNSFAPLLVQATVSIAGAIIAESTLSFLGLGVQPPTPSWGSMLNVAQGFLSQAPWMAWWPGLAIFVTVLAFNVVGDGLHDTFDPKEY